LSWREGRHNCLDINIPSVIILGVVKGGIMIRTLHLAAWVGILLGFLAGAGLGLFFHDEKWMGGYGSWRRRMMRLGHISFFGLALVNLALAQSIAVLAPGGAWAGLTWLFLVGQVGIPSVCFLAAWRKALRHLFFIPVLSLLAGTTIFLVEALRP
jgi:hypothetical protein